MNWIGLIFSRNSENISIFQPRFQQKLPLHNRFIKRGEKTAKNNKIIHTCWNNTLTLRSFVTRTPKDVCKLFIISFSICLARNSFRISYLTYFSFALITIHHTFDQSKQHTHTNQQIEQIKCHLQLSNASVNQKIIGLWKVPQKKCFPLLLLFFWHSHFCSLFLFPIYLQWSRDEW